MLRYLEKVMARRIAAILGDGVGKEVMSEGMRVPDAAAGKNRIDPQFVHFYFSSQCYFEKHGAMLPTDWKTKIGFHDAICFGAVGWPEKLLTTFHHGVRCCCSVENLTSASILARHA